MKLNAYLFFDGDCEAAFKFYAQALGGKIDAMIPYEGSPGENHTPADWRKKIMHARLVFGDQTLMGSDSPPAHSEKRGGFSISVNIDKPADAERIFKALAEKGTIKMALEKTFWAERFGMLVDRFGTPWMINCESAK